MSVMCIKSVSTLLRSVLIDWIDMDDSYYIAAAAHRTAAGEKLFINTPHFFTGQHRDDEFKTSVVF